MYIFSLCYKCIKRALSRCTRAQIFAFQMLVLSYKQRKSLKKDNPNLTLRFSTGACIENTLLSAQGVLSYSKLPSVTVVQGELVSGLTLLTSRTASMIMHHPAHLSALLQQYVRQQSPDSSTEGTPKAEAT